MSQLTEPKGVPFFSIEEGVTRYAKLEAQIQGYINSSDMGINASRDQDFGWRLGHEYVKKVRAFRRNSTKMEALTTRNGGQRPTTTQILYAIYGEELRAYREQAEEEAAPFEEQYLRDIREKSQNPPKVEAPDPLPETTSLNDSPSDLKEEEIPEDVDEADLEPADTSKRQTKKKAQ